MEATQDLPALLRAHGLTPSAPRVAIYAWLVGHPTHPTVDEIFRALRPGMPTLSRTTVYNVLHAFVAHGLADKVRTEDLELRYDGTTAPHAHFKCTACGALLDLGAIPEGMLAQAGLPEGCRVEASALTAWGLCPRCASMGNEQGAMSNEQGAMSREQ